MTQRKVRPGSDTQPPATESPDTLRVSALRDCLVQHWKWSLAMVQDLVRTVRRYEAGKVIR